MVKFGIISDTHITIHDDKAIVRLLLDQLKKVFREVDEIIHAGDVCDQFFFDELNKIAPTRAVKGNLDTIKNLKDFIKISAGIYNIGVIHELPENLEALIKQNNLHILIFGHSHQPNIKGTSYNALLLNPGSPTRPKAPPRIKGFKEPVARPTVLTLEINDTNNIVSTFIINLSQ
ncbi:MAG: metallophosphoesterase [Promethearchaeota archaeon]|nr:MAG: metallophosphoesterase [Candidatus Lokiarchaeota archaeon]